MAKARTRKNGDGSVVTLKRKGKPSRYAAELTLGYADGKRRYIRSASTATRTEADALLITLREQHGRGIDVKSRDTLGPFITHWLDHTVAPNAEKLKTVQSYRWPVTRIVAKLGTRQLRHLTHSMLQTFLNNERTKDGAPVSKSTAELIRVVLKQALAQARREGLMTHDPAADLKLPVHKTRSAIAPADKPKNFLMPDEARAFLKTIQGDRLELAMRMELSLAFRKGEVCGLRWSDIDLDAGRLTITGTLGRIEGMGLVWDTPKSGKARGPFKLPSSLVAALRLHRMRQQAEHAALKHLYPHDHDYVFTSTRGGPLHPETLYQHVKDAVARIGRPELTPHGLRHSAASFLYEEGVPIKDISVYLGHSSTATTELVYLHVFGKRLDDNVERLERMLQRDDDRDETEAI